MGCDVLFFSRANIEGYRKIDLSIWYRLDLQTLAALIRNQAASVLTCGLTDNMYENKELGAYLNGINIVTQLKQIRLACGPVHSE